MLAVVLLAACNNSANSSSENQKVQMAAVTEPELPKPILLNEAAFKTKVFDFTSGKEWSYAGDKPCIIDFYADWCGPCKRLSPILDELAITYKDQIYIYKVNTDYSQNVSAFFRIDGIPATFFVPMNGEPKTMVGLYPKEEYIRAIEEILLKKGK